MDVDAVSKVMEKHDMEALYIWQLEDWPQWRYQSQQFQVLLNKVYYQQGVLLGRMRDCGMDFREEASLNMLTENIVQSSAIEGEKLSVHSIRSSLARKLGVEVSAIAPIDRHIDGVVEMMLDATTRYEEPLSLQRLYGWHAALFPTGYSGLSQIKVAQLRDDLQGAMQVISGRYGREKVHYQAPPAQQLPEEMTVFLAWMNKEKEESFFVQAAIAHLWFLTLHPFDDGNGRMARAISDGLLARADQSALRFYSMSAQIQKKRHEYYAILEQTQKGNLDITQWIQWFLTTLLEAMEQANQQLDQVLLKAQCWQKWRLLPLNERQIKVLNRLLDGFEGVLNNRKWVAIAHCSRDTALRDINDLIDKGVLEKASGGGRSVNYVLKSRK